MVNTLSGALSRLSPINALVIGDLMLDVYTKGAVNRVSPESPVVVLNAQDERSHAGGAGNVGLNLLALGATVRMIGRIGDDTAGQALQQELEEKGIDVSGLVVDPSVPTPVKNRLIASGQQLLRIDHEKIAPLPEAIEQQLIDRLPQLLEGMDVVAVSDYAKGLLTPTLLQALIGAAWSRGIPVIVDPKGTDFSKYTGCTLIKPNLSEAKEAANLPAGASINQLASALRKQVQSEYLVVTLAEGGIAVFDEKLNRGDFPARVREVNDVTGAGDTVLATLTCALANGLSISEAAQISNVAAGIAIEQVGCVSIDLQELASRLLDYDVVHKVFDEEHLFALKKAVSNRRFVVVGMSSVDGITGSMYHHLRQLRQGGKREVVVYLRDDEPLEDFVLLLESLREVSYVVLKQESLVSFVEQLHPEEVYLLEADALTILDQSVSLLN